MSHLLRARAGIIEDLIRPVKSFPFSVAPPLTILLPDRTRECLRVLRRPAGLVRIADERRKRQFSMLSCIRVSPGNCGVARLGKYDLGLPNKWMQPDHLEVQLRSSFCRISSLLGRVSLCRFQEENTNIIQPSNTSRHSNGSRSCMASLGHTRDSTDRSTDYLYATCISSIRSGLHKTKGFYLA